MAEVGIALSQAELFSMESIFQLIDRPTLLKSEVKFAALSRKI